MKERILGYNRANIPVYRFPTLHPVKCAYWGEGGRSIPIVCLFKNRN
jgi:hypothetical protein